MNKKTMTDVEESQNEIQLKKNGYWIPENNDLQQELTLLRKIGDAFYELVNPLEVWASRGDTEELDELAATIEQIAGEATAWRKTHPFPLTVAGNPWGCIDPLREAVDRWKRIQKLRSESSNLLEVFIKLCAKDCVALVIWADAQVMWLLDRAYTSATTTAEIAAAEAREAKANERAAKAEGKAELAHEWALVAEKKRAKAEDARRKAEIALAELKARVDERNKKAKKMRGTNIPPEIKTIVGEWHEQHFHVGETMQQAYDRFSVSNEGNKPSVAKYVTGWKVYKRVVEAYQRGLRREAEKNRKKKSTGGKKKLADRKNAFQPMLMRAN